MNISERQKVQKAIIRTLSAGPNTWQAIQRAAMSCDIVKYDQSQTRVVLNGLISAGIVKRHDRKINPEIAKCFGGKVNTLECYCLISSH